MSASDKIMFKFGLDDWSILDIVGSELREDINNGKVRLGLKCRLIDVIMATDDGGEEIYKVKDDAVSCTGENHYTRLILNHSSTGMISVGFRYDHSLKTVDWKTSDTSNLIKAIVIELEFYGTRNRLDSIIGSEINKEDDSDELYVNPINYCKEIGKLIAWGAGIMVLYYLIECLAELAP